MRPHCLSRYRRAATAAWRAALRRVARSLSFSLLCLCLQAAWFAQRAMLSILAHYLQTSMFIATFSGCLRTDRTCGLRVAGLSPRLWRNASAGIQSARLRFLYAVWRAPRRAGRQNVEAGRAVWRLRVRGASFGCLSGILNDCTLLALASACARQAHPAGAASPSLCAAARRGAHLAPSGAGGRRGIPKAW